MYLSACDDSRNILGAQMVQMVQSWAVRQFELHALDGRDLQGRRRDCHGLSHCEDEGDRLRSCALPNSEDARLFPTDGVCLYCIVLYCIESRLELFLGSKARSRHPVRAIMADAASK